MNKLILILVFAATAVAEDHSEIKLDDGLSLDLFKRSDLPRVQCGCWYHYPFESEEAGKVIAQGEAAEEAIYIVLNNKKTKIGNWKADYRKDYHLVNYFNDKYKINIHSKDLMVGRYSSDYKSTITIEVNSEKYSVEAFGSCGC